MFQINKYDIYLSMENSIIKINENIKSINIIQRMIIQLIQVNIKQKCINMSLYIHVHVCHWTYLKNYAKVGNTNILVGKNFR